MANPTNAKTADGLVVGMTDSGMKTVRSMLDQMKNQIQMALPRHMTADRMIRVALTSVQKNPKLLECAPVTLIGAIVQLAQLGLEPDDGTGKAYLIPFWNGKKQRMEVQAMPGFRGLVHLARNSGDIATVIPRAVHEKDRFAYNFGTDEIDHVPFDGVDPGPLKYVYAIAKFKDGSRAFDVMTMPQVEEVHQKVAEKNKPRSGKNKDGSAWSESGPWVDHYDEMAKKTVVRRLCKHLPSSPELQKAVMLDEKADFAVPQDLGNLILPESEKTSEAIDTPAAPKRLSDTKAAPKITADQIKQLIDLCEDRGIPAPDLNAYLKETYNIASADDIRIGDFDTICKWVMYGPEPPSAN